MTIGLKRSMCTAFSPDELGDEMDKFRNTVVTSDISQPVHSFPIICLAKNSKSDVRLRKFIENMYFSNCRIAITDSIGA